MGTPGPAVHYRPPSSVQIRDGALIVFDDRVRHRGPRIGRRASATTHKTAQTTAPQKQREMPSISPTLRIGATVDPITQLNPAEASREASRTMNHCQKSLAQCCSVVSSDLNLLSFRAVKEGSHTVV